MHDCVLMLYLIGYLIFFFLDDDFVSLALCISCFSIFGFLGFFLSVFGPMFSRRNALVETTLLIHIRLKLYCFDFYEIRSFCLGLARRRQAYANYVAKLSEFGLMLEF